MRSMPISADFFRCGELSIPAEFKDREWDFSKFSRGERFVYEAVPQAEFDEVMQQVERWGLDQHLKERQFENLVPSSAS